MKIRFDPPGGSTGPESTAEAHIDLQFRPREIEKVLMHVGREGEAISDHEVKLVFRGELVADLKPYREGGEDVVGLTLHLSFEGK